MFLKTCMMESAFFFFFEMKERCKECCVKIIAWSIVVKEGTTTLVFCIFKCGCEYGAECSGESSAK